MIKVLERQDNLITLDPVKTHAKSVGFFMSFQATGSFNFGYLGPFFKLVLLPIIYLNSFIRKGLGYINLSSLLPHIAPFRGSYEAFSF